MVFRILSIEIITFVVGKFGKALVQNIIVVEFGAVGRLLLLFIAAQIARGAFFVSEAILHFRFLVHLILVLFASLWPIEIQRFSVALKFQSQ